MGQAKGAHMTCTQKSHPIGQNTIVWPYVTAVLAGKSDVESKEMDFNESIIVSATHVN